ncbi:MAG: alpha/beta hydrolase, partial [Beijerinckiaceae bacterium]
MRIRFAASLLVSCLLSSAALATTPPTQPEKGPGGADYTVAANAVKKEAFGSGAQQVFVFTPTGNADKPRPVIVFLHAYGAYNPKIYGAWIEHLVRRDMIVVFPRFQVDART